jgi:plastocyanin
LNRPRPDAVFKTVNRRPRRRLVSPCCKLLVVALFALTALTGCGGDDSESSAEGTTTEASATTEAGATTEAAAGGSTIKGSVGPGFDIGVEGADSLTPGTYTLVVEDKSSSHNFHLTGPGVDVKTEVSFEGDMSFTVNLQAGKYHFQCDPHSSSMNGDFTVSG